ncbi:hypothetical protein G6F62_015467 [Rhizopus arrhizus]|nr:hypothetical protein G6F62_015467 [Rhizopus arrhizus]
MDEVVRHVLEQADQIHLLLVIAAQGAARLLPHDRHHGLMVQLGVVQAVKQMDGAGAGSRQAHPDLARELGMGASHERRAFFVARLDKLQFFVSSERADQPVNPVAGIAANSRRFEC